MGYKIHILTYLYNLYFILNSFWFENKLHGEGRMIYSNGDVYEGQWCMGKRSGYGVLTKSNFFIIHIYIYLLYTHTDVMEIILKDTGLMIKESIYILFLT